MIGIILRQRYKIIKPLGSGGFGETYLAEDFITLPINPKPLCVVKRLKPEKRDEPETLRRFKEEATILQELGNSHDQIPKLIDYFQENRDFYLVQDYIEGHDLSNEIIQGIQCSEADVTRLLQEILEVLASVHQQGVIHRDIKPSNLMRRYSDDKFMLIDFGIVKELSTLVVNAQGQISSTTCIGTLGYMPSEQLQGHPKLCSDVYALGLTAIQALTGILPPQQLPKDPNTLEVIWRDRVQVSDWLANILTKMVRYHFLERYQSATEALQALNQAQALNPAQALNQAVVSPPSRPALIDTKRGYIDQTGQVFIQPTFNTMHAITNRFFEWLQPAKIGKKWGYVNQAKKVVIPPQFDYAWDFSEGLAVVKIGNKQGYIDQTGEIVIPPEFDKAKPFSGGRAQIKMGEQQRHIDKTGKFIDPE